MKFEDRIKEEFDSHKLTDGEKVKQINDLEKFVEVHNLKSASTKRNKTTRMKFEDRIKEEFDSHKLTDGEKVKQINDLEKFVEVHNLKSASTKRNKTTKRKINYRKNRSFAKKLIPIFSAVLAVIVVGIVVIPMFFGDKNTDDPTNLTKPMVHSIEYKETLNDVDKNIDIPIVSTKSLISFSGNISISNQNGNAVDCDLKSTGNGGYLIKAPGGGYKPGDTYKIKLLSNDITFKDETYSSRREITFTIYKDDILDIKQKKSVIEVETNKTYKLIDDTKIYVDVGTATKNNIAANDIILLPVYDENGFAVVKAFRVLSIDTACSDWLLTVETPEIEEVYDELEIKGNFDAIYSDDYIKAFSEEQIAEEIANSPVVQALSSLSSTPLSTTNNTPKVSVNIKSPGGKVVVEYKIEVPKIFKGVDFVIQGEIEIQIGARADVSLKNGTFDVGAVLSYKNEYAFALKFEKSLVGGNDNAELFKNTMQKLTDTLNQKVAKKEHSIKAFTMFLPTPVPALGFSFDVNLVFRLELKVQLQVTFIDEFSIEVGAKRDTDGINPYFNKISKTGAVNVEFSGSITAKLGLEVKFSGSIAGVLEAGVAFELGIYGKIAGSAKVGAISELASSDWKFNPSGNGYYCYAAYFEAGIYTSLSLFAEVDLIVYKAEAKFTFFETELPIFSIGHTQQYELDLSKDSLVLNSNGKAEMPEVTVKVKDMFTGEKKEQKIKNEDLNKIFKISSQNNNCVINDSYQVVSINGEAEFKDSIILDLRELQTFFDIVFKSANGNPTFEIDTNKRGIWHYELGALGISAKIDVVKQPVRVDSVKLDFNHVINDTEYSSIHPDYTARELQYNYKDDINGIKDFQIGRLVEIVPTITPVSASYKTLIYSVVKGSQYIVGGANGIRTYIQNGITYAEFRIIENTNAIGNIDGNFDWSKEIIIQARTDGYTGDYNSWNVNSTSNNRVLASPIPAINYEVTPVVANTNVEQTSARAGDEINFGINSSTVFPRNASRGEYGQEVLGLLSGQATEMGNGVIRINDDAEVGSQIILFSMLSGVKRQYYINIVKKAVESVEIVGEAVLLQPGGEVDIEAKIFGVDGGVPTINEVIFLIINGNDKANIAVDSVNKNKATLSVSASTKVGSIIEVIAIIDGQRSNTLQYMVSKIAVESVTLSTANHSTVSKGDIINLSSTVLPSNSTFKTPQYSIIDGSAYGVIDSQSGKLFIDYSCKGGEQIKVVSQVDGVTSNILTFMVENTPAKFVQFKNSSREYVRDNQTIILDAFVNPDATNQAIIYTIVSGDTYAQIVDNKLIINSGLTSQSIRVRATAADNSEAYAEKMYTIYSDLQCITINGRYDSVTMLAGEEAYAIVTDASGQILDNNLITFEVKDYDNNSTNLATINADGRITIRENISESVMSLTVVLYATYDAKTVRLYVDIIIPPQVVNLVLKADEATNSIGLKPNETVELVLKEIRQSNAAPLDNVYVEVQGNANVYLFAEPIGYGVKEYTVLVQLKDNAYTDETIVVYAYYVAEGKTIKSQAFTITVLRLVESVEITNAPSSMNIGESITLQYKTNPEIRYANAIFEFADSFYSRWAVLEEDTGLLTINSDAALLGYSVVVRVTIDGISSIEYEIFITDVVKEITISSDKNSKGVQYLDELGFYVLYPNGEFIVSAATVGGGKNPSITYSLDKIGQQYLSIAGNKITVKDVAINSGINATLVASVDGVVSNVIVIYIPTVIRTADDWFNIKNNVAGYYVLGNDIDFLGREYIPLSTFGGIIDGAGFSLRNITITNLTDRYNAGLIEENYGIIINLNVRQLLINISTIDDVRTAYVGGVAAKNYGYIINCIVQATGSNFIGIYVVDSYTGGITGMNAGTVRMCQNWIYIHSAGKVGGIAGLNTKDGYITDCFNAETISTNTYNKDIAVVGIAGQNDGQVTNCQNYGRVFDREKWEYIN